jgi:hypothetical protein
LREVVDEECRLIQTSGAVDDGRKALDQIQQCEHRRAGCRQTRVTRHEQEDEKGDGCDPRRRAEDRRAE